MVDIEELKPQIVERLKLLEPDKIILFGSYARGTATEESDIDLFIFKRLDRERVREFKLQARAKVRDLVAKYKIGFDFIVADEAFVRSRKDHFYQNDILQEGKVIYE
jgi:predicted nucleotidyltransferase